MDPSKYSKHRHDIYDYVCIQHYQEYWYNYNVLTIIITVGLHVVSKFMPCNYLILRTFVISNLCTLMIIIIIL